MKNSKKIKGEIASIENVKRFFANTPNVDEISLGDAFLAWGRPNPEDIEGNKAWLSNMLSHLKYHDLLVPVYTFDSGRKKLTKLRLTLKGKKMLGRIEGTQYAENEPIAVKNGIANSISVEDIMRVLPKLKQNNPDFNITFSVTPKDSVIPKE